MGGIKRALQNNNKTARLSLYGAPRQVKFLLLEVRSSGCRFEHRSEECVYVAVFAMVEAALVVFSRQKSRLSGEETAQKAKLNQVLIPKGAAVPL